MFLRPRESTNISGRYSKSLHKDDSKSAKEQFLYMTDSNEGGNNMPYSRSNSQQDYRVSIRLV